MWLLMLKTSFFLPNISLGMEPFYRRCSFNSILQLFHEPEKFRLTKYDKYAMIESAASKDVRVFLIWNEIVRIPMMLNALGARGRWLYQKTQTEKTPKTLLINRKGNCDIQLISRRYQQACKLGSENYSSEVDDYNDTIL